MIAESVAGALRRGWVAACAKPSESCADVAAPAILPPADAEGKKREKLERLRYGR